MNTPDECYIHMAITKSSLIVWYPSCPPTPVQAWSFVYAQRHPHSEKTDVSELDTAWLKCSDRLIVCSLWPCAWGSYVGRIQASDGWTPSLHRLAWADPVLKYVCITMFVRMYTCMHACIIHMYDRICVWSMINSNRQHGHVCMYVIYIRTYVSNVFMYTK